MTEEKGTKSDMMYCSECGTKIRRDVKFCEECGSRIHSVPPDETMINGNPFGDTYVNKPGNVNLIKVIIIAICATILALLWMCVPVVQINYASGVSSISDYFSSSEYNKNLSMGKLFDIAGNMIDYAHELPEDLQTALIIMLFIFFILIVFVIFAGIFIYSLIKLDAEAIKEDGPRVTICTFIILFLLFCLVVTFNNFVENDYIDIMRFEFGTGSYIIIVLTIVMQCIVSSLTVKKEESKAYMGELDRRRNSWICPTCGTNNPGNVFCNKCGFENSTIR